LATVLNKEKPIGNMFWYKVYDILFATDIYYIPEDSSFLWTAGHHHRETKENNTDWSFGLKNKKFSDTVCSSK